MQSQGIFISLRSFVRVLYMNTVHFGWRLGKRIFLVDHFPVNFSQRSDLMTNYAPPPDTGLDIVYADSSFVVVSKPAELLSVPGRGVGMDDCLVSRVQARYPDALAVHRLDMSTSGLMVLARGSEVHRNLSRQFEMRQVKKRYLAVVDGVLNKNSGEIDLPLICDWPNRPRQMVDHVIGKPSLTKYRVLESDLEASMSRVELEPITGRSHQLRVHMASLGHPILGDDLYGGAATARAGRLLLQATDLGFFHPCTVAWVDFHAAPEF